MPIDNDRLRLVAAMCHSVDDADVELFGLHGRLLVSYRRSDATIDPGALPPARHRRRARTLGIAAVDRGRALRRRDA